MTNTQTPRDGSKVVRPSQTPNAVCQICLKNGKVTPAAAERQWGHWNRFFVCDGHAERAERWDRVVVAYEQRHPQVQS